MRRLKCQRRSSQDSGLPDNRDTPLKTGLTRGRGKYGRLLPKNYYEPLPEEPLLEETDVPTAKPSIQLWTNRKPIQYKKMVRFSSPVFTENLREKPATPATQNAGSRVPTSSNPANQMTPDPEAFQGGETPVKEEAENLAVTPESVGATGAEQAASVSSDDDEEDCYSSTSASSSSLPSPEIFCREDNYAVESLAFPAEEELLDLHLHVKNSTLLDGSCAENIHMYQPLNLSTIIDASVSPAEKEHEISYSRGTEVEPKRCTQSFKSDKASKTTPKLTNRKPIRYKKVVRFNSQVLAESLGSKNIPSAKLTNHNAGGPVRTSSLANRMTADAETFKAGEIIPKEETQPLRVTLKESADTNQEQAKFFDFADDRDRDAFFQRLRNRYAKLRSAALFPLNAARQTEPYLPMTSEARKSKLCT